MTKETLTLEELKHFFEERKLLSINAINKEANLGGGHLHKILKGERPLGDETTEKLYPILFLYGFRK